MQVEDWLFEKAPGFSKLSQEERDAISNFSFLWGLFEGRILNMHGSAGAICAAVDRWHDTGTFESDIFEDELTYFQERYHPASEFSAHYDGLHFRPPDREAMVRSVLNGSDLDPRHRVATALIIVFRYRNNLFHGPKWTYELAGQLNNFNVANSILMKVLDRYGALG